ncbi:hypothetical protein ACVWZ4_003355 [Bradyrhizobium sp. USDA 4472]
MLAQLEAEMRHRHQHRRQAPDRDEQLAGATVTTPAAKPQNGNRDACNDRRDVSNTAQREQIGIVLVRGRECEERRAEPEQDEAETTEELHDASRPGSG